MADTVTSKSLGAMSDLELELALVRLVDARASSTAQRAKILGRIVDKVLDEKLRRRDA